MADMHTPLKPCPQISEADVDIALRKLRMELFGASAPSGTIRLVDDILLSVMPLGRLAEILTDAVAQRIERSEPDEGRKDAGSTPVSILPAPSQDAETIKALRDDRYDQGRRDVLNAILALNPKCEALLAGLHEREPNPLGQLPFDVVVWVTEVAEQLGIQPKDETAAALAGSAS